MLTEKELEAAIEVILNRFDEVNTFFIKKVAEQIKKIGELGQANINRLVIMAEMSDDVQEINKKLAEATGLNISDLYRIYGIAMKDVYTDPRFTDYYAQQADTASATASQPKTERIKKRLSHYTQSVAMQTAQTMRNLSNTTAVLDVYKAAVDDAVIAVSSGMTDYSSATRQIIRSLGYNGLQVQYESGYHRRLDTAVRQNIVDGANQIAQNGAAIIGEELGFDAYELSAHMYSAPDHEPVQGRVFLKAEFDKMQSGGSFVDVDNVRYKGFKRPIGEWNCGHIAVPFDTKSSVRRYTDAQLTEWANANNAGCTINGKHCSIYKASQIMRKLETEVRRWKDTANAARIAGNDNLRNECQQHINSLSAKYSVIAKTAGLPTKRERMAVEGFKAVKLKMKGSTNGQQTV